MTTWVGLDATIIISIRKIWHASGHTSTFADPMVDCLLTQKRFRADQVEAQSGVAYSYEGAESKAANFKVAKSYSVLLRKGEHPDRARKVAKQYYGLGVKDGAIVDGLELLNEKTEKVENSTRFNPENGSLLTEPRLFNLMFKTFVGPVESEENAAYLRPETAQAIFAQFKNVAEVSRQKVPFGICQVGKAFRTEINPRNFTFRSREFEQMELEFSSGRMRWWKRFMVRWPNRRRRDIQVSLQAQLGAGKCGISIGWRSVLHFMRASGCHGRVWWNIGRRRMNWPITRERPWIYFPNFHSAHVMKKVN